MSETIETSTIQVDEVDVFTSAVRAVLYEIEYDGHLALPISLRPARGGVEMQVRYDDFDAWSAVLAGQQLTVDHPAYRDKATGTLQEHLRSSGTINNHQVSIVTVHHLTEAVA